MALKRNMSIQEMVSFLDNELLPQAQLEIKSWIKPRKRQGGYFVVSRQILCMVDFLGAVYSGYPLPERKNDPDGRKIATSAKAKKFIVDFFEPKQTYEPGVVSKLHDMYRNGLVHLYQPKIMKWKSKGKLMWFLYKGKRFVKKIEMDSNQGKIIFKNVSHLKIVSNDPNKKKYYLAICIDTLYEDFEKAVITYRDKLKNTKYLQGNWRTAVNAICKPR